MTRHAIIAFDGLSLAGKSTMVQMLAERSENAEVIRENTADPIRPAIAMFNKAWNEGNPWQEFNSAIKRVCEIYPEHAGMFAEAKNYAESYDESPDYCLKKQAMLAYLFTKGRKKVNETVMNDSQQHDIILDRWQLTGWAYQATPYCGDGAPLSCENIRNLNLKNGIIEPDLQFIMSCPLEQIPRRRAHRQKIGAGTAGQMSPGKEGEIYANLKAIHAQLMQENRAVAWVENKGTPTSCIEEQIRQAVPGYREVEGKVRACISKIPAFNEYRLKDELGQDGLEEYFLQPSVLKRIYERQTSRR